MQTKIIEATNGPLNWGKFLLGRHDVEWQVPSAVNTTSPFPLLSLTGMARDMIWVLDLQTREGACFRANPRASAEADLKKHKIWVCPLFEPFLDWLYQQNVDDLEALPALVDLPDAPFEMRGHRRPGAVAAPRATASDAMDALATIEDASRLLLKSYPVTTCSVCGEQCHDIGEKPSVCGACVFFRRQRPSDAARPFDITPLLRIVLELLVERGPSRAIELVSASSGRLHFATIWALLEELVASRCAAPNIRKSDQQTEYNITAIGRDVLLHGVL